MTTRLLIFGAGSLMALALSPLQTKWTGPVPRERALELYTSNCQPCHGPEGIAPAATKELSFVGRQWKHGSQPGAIVATITNGVPGTAMLPFKDRLTRQEITALARLVRSYDKTLKPAAVGRR